VAFLGSFPTSLVLKFQSSEYALVSMVKHMDSPVLLGVFFNGDVVQGGRQLLCVLAREKSSPMTFLSKDGISNLRTRRPG
jgi:hypothetical protein